MQTETIQIHTEFIKLQDLLKFAGAVGDRRGRQDDYPGGPGGRQRGALHHAGQEAAPRGTGRSSTASWNWWVQ